MHDSHHEVGIRHMTDTTAVQAVEQLLALPFVLMGLSHIVQPQLWVSFFDNLDGQGKQAVVWRSFTLELWPAVLIVSFHQDWTWPGILLTLYGHALMVKVALSLLAPNWGRKTLQHAGSHSGNAMRAAGVILMLLGVFCAWRTFF